MFVPILFYFILFGFINAHDSVSSEESGESEEQNEVDFPKRNALRLYCGEKSSLVSVYNIRTKIAIIIDSQNDMSLVCDGNSGVQYLYDHSKHTVVQISRHRYSWFASKTKIQAYMKSIRSVKTILIRGGIRTQVFSIGAVPNNIIRKHYIMIQGFQPEVVDYGAVKIDGVFSMFVNLLKDLCRMKKQTLGIIFQKKLESKTIVVKGLMNVVSVFRGLSTLINETSGYIKVNILKKKFDLKPLFQAECGTESLAIIANQINDPNSRTFQILKYPNRLYNVVREFGGGLYTGLRGVEELVYHFILFLKNQVSLEVFMDLLIQVSASLKHVSHKLILKKINFTRQILMTKVSASCGKNMLEYLDAFSNHRLTIANINISSIVNNFYIGGISGVRNIINTLHSLKSGFLDNVCLLFRRLVFFTLKRQGLFYILKLIPHLKPTIMPNVPIIMQINRLPKPIMNISETNVENIIGSIPVVGNIFEEIMNSLVEFHPEKELWIRKLCKTGSLSTLLPWINLRREVLRGPMRPIEPMGCIHEMGLWGIDRTNGCSCYD